MGKCEADNPYRADQAQIIVKIKFKQKSWHKNFGCETLLYKGFRMKGKKEASCNKAVQINLVSVSFFWI
jgi:hypothetical protein